MCENLTPDGARRVLAFMDVQKSVGQMPPHVLKRLIEKSCEDVPAPPPTTPLSQVAEVREAPAAGPPCGAVGVGILQPPAGGVFPDGSKLDVDEDGQAYPF